MNPFQKLKKILRVKKGAFISHFTVSENYFSVVYQKNQQKWNYTTEIFDYFIS